MLLHIVHCHCTVYSLYRVHCHCTITLTTEYTVIVQCTLSTDNTVSVHCIVHCTPPIYPKTPTSHLIFFSICWQLLATSLIFPMLSFVMSFSAVLFSRTSFPCRSSEPFNSFNSFPWVSMSAQNLSPESRATLWENAKNTKNADIFASGRGCCHWQNCFLFKQICKTPVNVWKSKAIVLTSSRSQWSLLNPFPTVFLIRTNCVYLNARNPGLNLT